MSLIDQTPSQTSRVHKKLEIRSLRDVISSCDKLNLQDSQSSVSASLESISAPDSGRKASGTAWVSSFHDKMQARSPAKYYSTPTHRQLNFSTPAAKQPDRPSPTVSSVYSDRWCLESMTPGMRFTPPSMAMRGMRMNGHREAIAAYRMDMSVRRENERGASLCILPTPLLHQPFRDPLAELSPQFVPSRPSPTISAVSPSPAAPVHKKPRPNSRHFPIPRPSSVAHRQRRPSLDISNAPRRPSLDITKPPNPATKQKS